MSYILEALKKAQAERQLGAAPTLHAATLAGATAAQRGSAWKKPLMIAVPAMGAAILVLLGLLWKQSQTAPDGAAAPAAADGARLGAAPPPRPALPQQQAALQQTAQQQGLPQQPTSQQPTSQAPRQQAGLGQALPPEAPSHAATPPSAQAAQSLPPGQARPTQDGPARSARRQEQPAAPSARTTARVEPARPAPAAPEAARAETPSAKPSASDDAVVQTLRDLPEPIQRAIPAITMGGYIYSKNPADRLLVIDKVLRREGEELAPGFVLEKLLPREAIFNYKGYRYRAPY
ncbi:general secretion pathway protein GspB [Oxalobacteraceae bacterium A2-2]